jgi:hypothetical protein
MDENFTRGQRIFSTSVTNTKRTLAQVIIVENFHLAKMEVQAILLEVRCFAGYFIDIGYESTATCNRFWSVFNSERVFGDINITA